MHLPLLLNFNHCSSVSSVGSVKFSQFQLTMRTTRATAQHAQHAKFAPSVLRKFAEKLQIVKSKAKIVADADIARKALERPEKVVVVPTDAQIAATVFKKDLDSAKKSNAKAFAYMIGYSVEYNGNYPALS